MEFEKRRKNNKENHIFLALIFAKVWPSEVGKDFGYKIWVWKPHFQEDEEYFEKINH